MVMSNTHFIAGNESGPRAVASALRDSVDDISRALEPLLFPRGIPEDLDIPMVLSALADVLERGSDAADANRSRLGDRAADGAPALATGQMPAQASTPSPAACRAARMPAETPPAEAPSIDGSEAMTGAASPFGGACGQREQTIQALRHLLLRIRGLLASVCGPQAPRLYALDGRIPDDPETLLVFARKATRALERAEPEEGRAAPFITLDLAGAAACLREHADALDSLLHVPEAGSTGAHPTARDEPPWDRRQHTVTSIAKALLRLADERAAARSMLRHSRAGTAPGPSRPAAERSAI